MAKSITPLNTKPMPATVGAPGLPVWAGVVMSEWDRRLQGSKGPQTYREMAESSATIGALLFAIESMVRGAGYRLEPADESAEAEAEAEFVTSCIEDMEGAWGDTLSEILTLIPYGFSLFEVVYKRRVGETGDLRTESAYDDGRIGWARWSPRSQETIVAWSFRDDHTAESAIQIAPPNYREVTIPLDKCLHFRARSRRQNPEGMSLIRNCFESWYYLKNLTRIEAIGIERDLAGLPVVRISAEVIVAGGSELNTYTKMATDLRRDEQAGVVLPSDVDENGNALYELSLLSTGGQRAIDTDAVIARYERWILRAMLADFLTLGDQGVGSYAQSVSRTDLFLTAVGAILDGIRDVINVQAIRPLMRLNGVPSERWPSFMFNEIDTKDVKAFAETVAVLVGAQIVDPSEPDVKQYVYDMVGLPLAQETDEQEQDAADAPESPTSDGTDANEQEDMLDPIHPDDAKTATEFGVNLHHYDPRSRAETLYRMRTGQWGKPQRTAMEPLRVDDELMAAARAAWRERMKQYGGLLDAEVA